MKSEVVEIKVKKEEFKAGFYQTDDGLIVYMEHPGKGCAMVAALGWEVFGSLEYESFYPLSRWDSDNLNTGIKETIWTKKIN